MNIFVFINQNIYFFMKKLQLFVVLFIASIAVSCSSDDGGDSTGGGNGGNFQASFEYVFDGNPLNIALSQGQKSGNSMVVAAADSEGNAIQFRFDKFGNLGTVSATPSDFEMPDYDSHQNYSGHYFTFNLIEVDETNKTVKASFSGKLYEDDENLDSEFKEVSGSFWVKYIEVTPSVEGLEVSAQINGNDWYSTNSYTTNGTEGWDTFIHHELSDDEYKIMLGFDDTNMGPGVHSFTPATETIYATVAKYNLETKTYETFNATGTLEITANESFGIFTIVSGTYSFTAVNPSDSSETITVTNGKFKSNYSW